MKRATKKLAKALDATENKSEQLQMITRAHREKSVDFFELAEIARQRGIACFVGWEIVGLRADGSLAEENSFWMCHGAWKR